MSAVGQQIGGFADFTEAAYSVHLARAMQRFRILPVTEALVAARDGAAQGLAAWRHDIDMSPQRARALARIEAAVGIRASYFVLLSGPFYNPLEETIVPLLREIAALGHEIGLHLDGVLAAGDPIGRLSAEASLLSAVAGAPVRAFSLHNPSVAAPAALSDPQVAGLLNATDETLRAPFTYVSDSNGIWRFRPLGAVIDDPGVRSMYALTHPEWWTPEPMLPAQRIRRCIEGRAEAVARGYETLIATHRPEVLQHVR